MQRVTSFAKTTGICILLWDVEECEHTRVQVSYSQFLSKSMQFPTLQFVSHGSSSYCIGRLYRHWSICWELLSRLWARQRTPNPTGHQIMGQPPTLTPRYIYIYKCVHIGTFFVHVCVFQEWKNGIPLQMTDMYLQGQILALVLPSL